MTRQPLDGGREVLGRHVKAFGIVTHVTLGATDTGSEQCHQLFDDVGRAVGVRVGGFTLRMRLKDVIHHRQAQAAHHFIVEQQVAVIYAFTQTMEILEQTAGLGVGERDDGIPVQADAAADAVIVGRQQILQETVVGSEPLHLHAWGSREILGTMWRRHHDKVVLHDVVTALVEHKTPLACCADQMHTGITKFPGIHPVEVGGKKKIYLHGC